MACLPIVLIVEDDGIILADVVLSFVEAGWIVREASTGEHALAQLREPNHGIQALFTDIQLGGLLTGWELAEAARKECPELPVFYASGQTADGHRQLASTMFFSKPYNPTAVLRACTDAVCDQRRTNSKSLISAG